MHLTATRDGNVWGIAAGQHPDDFAVANEEGMVDGSPMSRDAAMSEVHMACGRMTALSRISAEALIAGDDAMCRRLAAGAERVIAHLTTDDY